VKFHVFTALWLRVANGIAKVIYAKGKPALLTIILESPLLTHGEAIAIGLAIATNVTADTSKGNNIVFIRATIGRKATKDRKAAAVMNDVACIPQLLR